MRRVFLESRVHVGGVTENVGGKESRISTQ